MAKNEQSFLVWRTTEFEHYEKSFGWYLTLHIIAILIIGYEIWAHDFFAALTLFIAYLALMWYARQRPQEVEVTISNRGVKINTYQIPYGAIRRFWIVHHAEAKDLHLETTAYLNRFVIIPLRDQDPFEVSSFLGQHIPESEPNREALSRRIARKLKI